MQSAECRVPSAECRAPAECGVPSRFGWVSGKMSPMVKCVAVLLGVGLGCGVAAQRAVSPVDTGRRLYDRGKCATCHQIEKRGNSRYPLDGVASRLTGEQLRRWLVIPAEMEAALPRMPALRMSTMKYRFNAQELDALVAYLQTLK